MSFGALVLRFRQKYGHGFRVAYLRDIVRARILTTRPITATDDYYCEIHVLTSSQDWLNLIWSLKSFYLMSGRRYALCIHEDGSVAAADLEELRRHFPAARIIRRRDADAQACEFLRAHPRCLEFRRTNPLSLKLFDSKMYLNAERMLLFDSDLLFFGEPLEFLRRVEDSSYRCNTFNGDVATAYSFDWKAAEERLGFEVIERINSGFGLVHARSIRLDWIEEFLGAEGILDGHPWRIEQTLFALLSSRFGAELLPQEYSVYLTPGLGGRPFRHYVGAIRHMMYREGMAELLRRAFLRMEHASPPTARYRASNAATQTRDAV